MLEEEEKQNVENNKYDRKWTKPAMEKRRRERINRNLQELKYLVLEALNRDSLRYSKLEKADILEMTVKHLRRIRSQRKAVAIAANPNVLCKYSAGYNECMAEVSRYMTAQDSIDAHVKARILSHLASSCRATNFQSAKIGFYSSPVVERTPNGGGSGHLPGYLIQAPQNFMPVRAPANIVPVSQIEIPNDQNLLPHINEMSTSSALQLRKSLWRPWKTASELEKHG